MIAKHGRGQMNISLKDLILMTPSQKLLMEIRDIQCNSALSLLGKETAWDKTLLKCKLSMFYHVFSLDLVLNLEAN